MNFFCDNVCNYCSVLRQSCSGRYTINAPLSLVGPYALPIPNHLHKPLCSSGFDHRTAGPHDYSNATCPVIGHHKSPSHNQAFSQFSQVSPQLDLMCEHSFISFYKGCIYCINQLQKICLIYSGIIRHCCCCIV